jgi:hypothetical protein
LVPGALRHTGDLSQEFFYAQLSLTGAGKHRQPLQANFTQRYQRARLEKPFNSILEAQLDPCSYIVFPDMKEI